MNTQSESKRDGAGVQSSLTRREFSASCPPRLERRGYIHVATTRLRKPPAKAGTLNACCSRDSFTPSTRRSLARMLLACLCLFASLHESPAQEPRRPQPPSQQQAPAAGQAMPASPNVLYSTGEDYRIGPSDVLDITVEDAPELSGAFRVNASGTFPMRFIGSIKAQGATPEELQRLIADKLRGEYLMNPQVTVLVRQYNSRAFFIQGSVKNPGVYQIEGKPSLLKLITMAGGLAENHGSTAFIIREIKKADVRDQRSDATGQRSDAGGQRPDAGGERPEGAGQRSDAGGQRPEGAGPRSDAGGQRSEAGGSKPEAGTQDSGASASTASDGEVDDAKYELKLANINSLLLGNFKQNLIIEPGDIINVPPTDIFFVAGEVRSPGSYTLREGTSLRQAISLAQGMTFKALASRGVIFRTEAGTGKRQEIKVNINDVMSGKKEDMLVQANDIIIVPNSRFKSVGSVLLTGFGTVATRVPIP
jgi:protein involved in polysaccharide export with SLBB domain